MKTCPFYCPYMEIYACICVFVALSQWPPLPAASISLSLLLLLFFGLVMVFLHSLCVAHFIGLVVVVIAGEIGKKAGSHFVD